MSTNGTTEQRRANYLSRVRAQEEAAPPALLHDRYIGGCIAAIVSAVVLVPTILSAHNARWLALVAFLVLLGMAIYRYARGGTKNLFRLSAYDGAIAGIWLGAFFNMIGGVHLFGFINPFAVVGRIIVLIVFSLVAGGFAWLLRRRGPKKSGALPS